MRVEKGRQADLIDELRQIIAEQEKMLESKESFQTMKRLIDDQKLNTRKALSLVADIQREQAQSNYPAPDSLRYEQQEMPAGGGSTKRLSSAGSSGGLQDERISIGEVEFLPELDEGGSL